MNPRNKLLLVYPIYLIIVSCFILEIVLRIFSSKQDDRIILFSRRWLTLPPISTPSITAVDSNKNCYICYDDSLGWKIKQNSNSPPLYYTNSQGFLFYKETESYKLLVWLSIVFIGLVLGMPIIRPAFYMIIFSVIFEIL